MVGSNRILNADMQMFFNALTLRYLLLRFQIIQRQYSENVLVASKHSINWFVQGINGSHF